MCRTPFCSFCNSVKKYPSCGFTLCICNLTPSPFSLSRFPLSAFGCGFAPLRQKAAHPGGGWERSEHQRMSMNTASPRRLSLRVGWAGFRDWFSFLTRPARCFSIRAIIPPSTPLPKAGAVCNGWRRFSSAALPPACNAPRRRFYPCRGSTPAWGGLRARAFPGHSN